MSGRYEPKKSISSNISEGVIASIIASIVFGLICNIIPGEFLPKNACTKIIVIISVILIIFIILTNILKYFLRALTFLGSGDKIKFIFLPTTIMIIAGLDGIYYISIKNSADIYVDIVYMISLSAFWILFFIMSTISISFTNKNLEIHEDTALTTTCICFKPSLDNIATFLVFNPNFNQWQFPGGHVNIKIGEMPEQVCVRKALEEAGLKANILNLCDIDFKMYDCCESRKPPHFLYYITLDDRNQKCRKILHHNSHLDFSYVAEVEINFESNEVNRGFEIIQINIPIECKDYWDFVKIIKQSFELRKAIPNTLFPEDLPNRLWCAFKIYREYFKKQKSLSNDK